MVNNSENCRAVTAYQLSKDIKADYRAVRAILEDFERDNFVQCVGNSDISHNAKIYQIDNSLYNRIASLMQARKLKNASVASDDITRDFKQLKDLQMQVSESQATIKSLNELIGSKDKEIQALTNEKVILDADLTVARSELKFIEDKSRAVESAYSEKKLEVERLNKVIKQKDIALIILGAVILMGLTIVAVLAFTRGSML